MKLHYIFEISLILLQGGSNFVALAFSPSHLRSVTKAQKAPTSSMIVRMAAEKKRRRRKIADPSSGNDSQVSINEYASESDDSSMPSIDELRALANFTPKKGEGSSSIPITVPKSVSDVTINSERSETLLQELPDIKNVLKNKELKRLEEQEKEKRARPRISRSDKKAMRDLLEQEPFADTDASYFEEEEYGTVSALLGEGAKPFLGIPPGPLQVGHFIGALGIVLMAFVEYPGFPLTNLPTPLRDCLQGGLGTIYLCNTVLAVFAALAANERGQNPGLWAVKTFSVGGLALDQLTQLPKKKA